MRYNIIQKNKYMQRHKPPYKNGTIKLTWINPSDFSELSSEIFETLKDALKNTKDKKDWLVFRLNDYNGKKIKWIWELLPYGKSKKYINYQIDLGFDKK
jgi:hypothetical protein